MNDQLRGNASSLSIRDADDDDLDPIAAIWNEEIIHSVNTFKTVPLSQSERRQWWQKHAEPQYPVLVAEQSGELCGWASLSQFSSYEGYRPVAEVSVFVRPQDRGRGVAKQLYGRLIERADTIDHHVLIARIVAGNQASIRLHERFDFWQCGYLKEVGFKMNLWLDVVYMQRIHPNHRFGDRSD